MLLGHCFMFQISVQKITEIKGKGGGKGRRKGKHFLQPLENAD